MRESLRQEPKGEGPGSHLLSTRGSLSAPVTRRENTYRNSPLPDPASPGCATKQSVHSARRAPEARASGGRCAAWGSRLPHRTVPRPGPESTNSATKTPRVQGWATPRSAHARESPPPHAPQGPRPSRGESPGAQPRPVRSGRTALLPGAAGWSGRDVHSRSFSHCLSALLPPLPPAPPQLLRKSFAVSHDEREWERAGRAAAVGGRRCAQRGRGAAAASASRAGRAPGGRRRRRGLRAGDRVGAGRGQPEGGAGQPRRWLPRTQPGAATRAHPRPNRGRERSPRSAGSPRAESRLGRSGRAAGRLEAPKALRRGLSEMRILSFPSWKSG